VANTAVSSISRTLFISCSFLRVTYFLDATSDALMPKLKKPFDLRSLSLAFTNLKVLMLNFNYSHVWHWMFQLLLLFWDVSEDTSVCSWVKCLMGKMNNDLLCVIVCVCC